MTRRLPPQPNLEHLRKQAKELLERHRSEEPAIPFALHDAQRILARSYGFESWPKLKAFVDGVNVANLAEAVKSGDLASVRTMLTSRPELIGMDLAATNEHRALHFAVLRRDVPMVRLLMEWGADAHKGIYPHRDATSALTIAKEREYHDVVAVIEEEERLRREENSCPNATISPVQDRINAAIARGDAETAKSLLQKDLSMIQACDRQGATPLHIAAEAGNAELTAWLLERRANIRKPDLRGLTPLDRAALAAVPSFPAIAQLLLDHGAELTVRAAVALANTERVRELILADSNLLLEISPEGGLVTLAARHGHAEIVALLLDLGADVDERITLEELEEPTPSWGMPLWHAALDGNLEITRLLLDRGADPNANVYASGWPLRNAWHHEDESVKRLLLERGARPQPYMIAELHDVELARRFLAEDPSESLAREFVISAADHGCPEILELALPRLDWPPADPSWHWVIIQPIRGAKSAANEGHHKCMEILLERGIDPNVTRYGQTALHFAAAYRGAVSDEERARFAAALIDHGARLDLRDDLLKSTPLGYACRWGRRKLVDLLIARGAPIDEPDAEPWATPRAWARKAGLQPAADL
ncbi:MAG TPA: ankyrin repeat domain-containing protein [Bryobacteraceae bacterium]|nr:ankyrin repeat domain-containing protein [Bryobacteraceae bacterium]